MKPICIDLFCGMFGWGRGFAAEGYHVIGFDIEHHSYHGPVPENCELVLQDVLTLHGSQFRDAAIIVASPPCQRYSFMAMPFSRGKRQAAEIRADATGAKLADLNALFAACFRLQREASEAAGHHIPLVVENVKGTQAWVGRAAWHYGSYYLWGDVPALMPITLVRRMKSRISAAPRRFDERIASTPEEAHALHYRMPVPDGLRVPGMNFHDHEKTGNPGRSFQSAAVAIKNTGGSWFGQAHNTESGKLQNPVTINRDPMASTRGGARRAASAQIAQIPFELSSYIARVYKP